MAACGERQPAANTANKVDHSQMDHSKMDHSKMDHSSMPNSPGAAEAPFDLQFLDTMIMHHEAALQMAEPAAAQAEHDEIKVLARNILSSQDKEIKQMKAWREKWFPGAKPAINMDLAGMRASMADMNMMGLTNSKGLAFDLEFIRQMTPHHKGAVEMSEEALGRSTRDELKGLARDIIKAQQAEIDQMAKWAAAWKK